MSRIDDLIAEHCPDGVEFKALREVADFQRGSAMTVRSAVPGPYPLVANGPEPIATHNESNREGEFVVVARSGAYAGSVSRWRGPLFLTDAFSVHPHPDMMTTRFAYYLLQSQQDVLRGMKAGGGVPHVRVKEIEELNVPVPPAAVQREIAEILDKMDMLKAELEAELEYRSLQYAYYRDSLLTFKEAPPHSVRWVPMGEVGAFFRGRRFTKDDVVPDGLASIHYGEIYTGYGVFAEQPLSRVKPELAPSLRFASKGDVVIAAVGETVEDVAKAVAWLGDDDVAIHDDTFAFRHPMNPKFVAYYFQTSRFHAEKNKHVARAKVKRISGDSLGKIAIPVPEREEQDRIVAILDKFDALVNDLSIGLPAEINARRKQYAYHRDRLLTFEEAA